MVKTFLGVYICPSLTWRRGLVGIWCQVKENAPGAPRRHGMGKGCPLDWLGEKNKKNLGELSKGRNRGDKWIEDGKTG